MLSSAENYRKPTAGSTVPNMFSMLPLSASRRDGLCWATTSPKNRACWKWRSGSNRSHPRFLCSWSGPENRSGLRNQREEENDGRGTSKPGTYFGIDSGRAERSLQIQERHRHRGKRPLLGDTGWKVRLGNSRGSGDSPFLYTTISHRRYSDFANFEVFELR